MTDQNTNTNGVGTDRSVSGKEILAQRMARSWKRTRLIVSLALRNLFRQKRRNLLLGIAIGFGVMILLMANSFSRGITDILFNRMMVYAFGHIQVSGYEKGQFMGQSIIRDKSEIEKVIRERIQDLRFINESIGTFVRLIGNSKGENSMLVGINLRDPDPGESDENAWEIVSGDLADFTNGRYQFPVMLYEDKAKKLKVKIGDSVKARLNTISGQQQSASFTVVALLKSASMFQSMVAYVPFPTMKGLLGYQPWESGSLQVILKNPKTAIFQAENLFKGFVQNPLAISGEVRSARKAVAADLLAWQSPRFPEIKARCASVIGNISRATEEGWAAVSPALAQGSGLKPGDRAVFSFPLRFKKERFEKEFRIAAVVDSPEFGKDPLIFIGTRDLYKFYPENLPERTGTPRVIASALKTPPPASAIPVRPARQGKEAKKTDVKATTVSFADLVAPDVTILPRSHNSQEMEKKFQNLRKARFKGPSLDVATMYETMSQVVQLESALNIITFWAVLILFFIILIGVVNTLRMSIRERTREIGTIRALGMQENDVRDLFLAETLLLTFGAIVAGTIVGFGLMNLLRLVKFYSDSPLTILLVNKHLHFVATFGSVIGNALLILLMSGLTAWFPSRNAARMLVADALRHYE
jgi:ABC-type lipoprotein release transport system permease subunit